MDQERARTKIVIVLAIPEGDMDWIVMDRDETLKAISVLNLVPQRAGIPSSDYVRIVPKKSSIILTLASSVRASVRIKTSGTLGPDEFFVDRRLFLPFILMGKTWKGDFKMYLDGKTWTLRQGSRYAEFSLRSEKVGGYGEPWIDRSGMKEMKLSDALVKMLVASFSCSTSDPSMPNLNCVYLNGTTVMATNHTVLFMGTIGKSTENFRFPFPVEVIPLLNEGLVKGVGIEDREVILDCGCGYVVGSISSVAQKSFPKQKIQEQITAGRAWPLLVKLPAEKLSKMLGRLTEYLSGIRREDWVLQMDIGNNKLKATVKVLQGKFEETIELPESTGEGQVSWPLELVKPVLDCISSRSEVVKIRVDEKKKSPYLIYGGDIELMVARKKA